MPNIKLTSVDDAITLLQHISQHIREETNIADPELEGLLDEADKLIEEYSNVDEFDRTNLEGDKEG